MNIGLEKIVKTEITARRGLQVSALRAGVITNLINTPQFNPFRANDRKIYLGDFEVEAKILVVRKYGDFFQKSPNFVPRKYVS